MGFISTQKFREESAATSNMKIFLIIAIIGSAKAIETVGVRQQTPVSYGSEVGPVLYGAINDDGLLSESRILPEESGPKMSALPVSGLKTQPKILSLPYGQPLVYGPNPYVYIPAIGQVAKPVATKPVVYATHPYVYTHPIHISPIVPRGFAYSFTVDHDDTKSA